jgi:hypothetical protein
MGEDIVSLEGFNNKFSVIKSLQVSNTSLETLKGLGTIDTITELKLSDNKLLDSMAITITDSVIFEIDLRNNLELKHINELESLRTVFYFRLFGSYIPSIDGLKNLGLTDFCAISHLIGNEDFQLRINDNSYNPTAEDFLEGKCRLEK